MMGCPLDGIPPERWAETLEDMERQVLFAIQTFDRNMTREYYQACDEAYDLVRRETPIRQFLQAANYSPVDAAKRLVLRWKYRKEWFGEDQWLLPMVMTGQGALNEYGT